MKKVMRRVRFEESDLLDKTDQDPENRRPTRQRPRRPRRSHRKKGNKMEATTKMVDQGL